MERIVTRAHLHANEAAQQRDLTYWLDQPIQARIDALETLRRDYWRGQGHADIRLQRVCRITQLKSG